jgi:isoleucyl-tRNA synthetase
MIPVLDNQDREDILAIQNLIISEVNVKEIELLDDASGILVKNIKPNFKVLGPKYGKEMRSIGAAIQTLTQEDINNIEKEGEIDLKVGDNFVKLSIDEVEISSQDIEGWLVANQGGLTVALDVTISDELRKEGNARELINRVQNLRKDSGLEVTDRIKLSIENNAILAEAVATNKEYIMNETLTSELNFVEAIENGTDVVFDDVETKILIEKI